MFIKFGTLEQLLYPESWHPSPAARGWRCRWRAGCRPRSGGGWPCCGASRRGSEAAPPPPQSSTGPPPRSEPGEGDLNQSKGGAYMVTNSGLVWTVALGNCTLRSMKGACCVAASLANFSGRDKMGLGTETARSQNERSASSCTKRLTRVQPG